MTKNNIDLHNAFLKLMTLLGRLNGVSDEQIRDTLRHHPYAESLKYNFSGLEAVEDDIQSAFNNCIETYSEVGPSREYFTFSTLLNDLTKKFMSHGDQETRKLSLEILEK